MMFWGKKKEQTVPSPTCRYAIVWAKGDDIYTHQDDSGDTITYERRELDDLFKIDVLTTLDAVRALPDEMIGVPVDDLNHLLGVSS